MKSKKKILRIKKKKITIDWRCRSLQSLTGAGVITALNVFRDVFVTATSVYAFIPRTERYTDELLRLFFSHSLSIINIYLYIIRVYTYISTGQISTVAAAKFLVVHDRHTPRDRERTSYYKNVYKRIYYAAVGLGDRAVTWSHVDVCARIVKPRLLNTKYPVARFARGRPVMFFVYL